MPSEPLDYASPNVPVKQPRSGTLKWILIVLGLVVVAFIVFVILAINYAQSLGPYAG